VSGGHCKKVVGADVRVFANPDSTEPVWTIWPTGTLFWIEPGGGTSNRYRTTLGNGNAGWVTKDTRYVIDANGCP